MYIYEASSFGRTATQAERLSLVLGYVSKYGIQPIFYGHLKARYNASNVHDLTKEDLNTFLTFITSAIRVVIEQERQPRKQLH
jgi:hypothetical protein